VYHSNSRCSCSIRRLSYSPSAKIQHKNSKKTHASPLAPRYPPIPMEILPANISAIPANTTILVSPKAARPAVKANGTVRPSLNPSVTSDTVRGSICPLEDVEYAEENCEDDSDGGDEGSFSEF
jgi:hypothetical protein